MDILTRKDLQELISHSNGACLSLLMPTHTAGAGKQQDPIRYKNLLKLAEERMRERELDGKHIDALLKPARDLARDPFFWESQSSGLALYSAPGMTRTYRLPLSFEETAVVSEHFYLKPLLPYFANDGHFHLLALSQKHLRLLEGTRHSVDEINLEHDHPKLAEALRGGQFTSAVQERAGAKPLTDGEHMAMLDDPSDADKKRILNWFHDIDSALNTYLKGGHSPLVLAGVDSVVRLFREACSYPYLVEEALSGSPEEMRAETLHAQAWPLVAPIFEREQQEALGLYASQSDTDQALDEVRPILNAARHGRVETLFVCAGEKLWGWVDEESETVHIHREPEPHDRDLLDWAAVETLSHGGEVHVLAAGDMPAEALIAAILRY